MKEVYLDYAATTPLDPGVKDAMEPYMQEQYGNPSSLHKKGREARQAMENARIRMALHFSARPSEIVFTGSGTEAINLAIMGAARKRAQAGAGKHLVTTRIEHHAVLRAHEALEREGFEVTYVKVNRDGLVEPDAIRAALRPDTILVSVMYANNEIGTIQPIVEIGRVLKEFRGGKNATYDLQPKTYNPPLFFVDVCQAAGAFDLNVERLGADMIAINGSKIYGPKGVGALYVRRGVSINPIIHGGGQEQGLRSGTENVAGIVGLAAALDIAEQERERENARLTELRDWFIAEVKKRIPDAVLNGHATERLPNNINISIPGLEGEAAVLFLDTKGVYVSTGSACSSTSLEPSHVIAALGMPRAYAEGSLRITLGRQTTKDDLAYALTALEEVVSTLRRR